MSNKSKIFLSMLFVLGSVLGTKTLPETRCALDLVYSNVSRRDDCLPEYVAKRGRQAHIDRIENHKQSKIECFDLHDVEEGETEDRSAEELYSLDWTDEKISSRARKERHQNVIKDVRELILTTPIDNVFTRQARQAEIERIAEQKKRAAELAKCVSAYQQKAAENGEEIRTDNDDPMGLPFGIVNEKDEKGVGLKHVTFHVDPEWNDQQTGFREELGHRLQNVSPSEKPIAEESVDIESVSKQLALERSKSLLLSVYGRAATTAEDRTAKTVVTGILNEIIESAFKESENKKASLAEAESPLSEVPSRQETLQDIPEAPEVLHEPAAALPNTAQVKETEVEHHFIGTASEESEHPAPTCFPIFRNCYAGIRTFFSRNFTSYCKNSPRLMRLFPSRK